MTRPRKRWLLAVAASAAYWGFGLCCLVPHYLAPATFTPAVIGWAAVAVAPVTVAILARLYLCWLGELAQHRAGWTLSLALVGVHVPADYLFVRLALPEALPVWWGQFVPFVYPCLLIIPPLVAAAVSLPANGCTEKTA
jgi:hypothetical protein